MELQRRAAHMKKQKYYVTKDEWKIILLALNDLRSRRLAEDKCIDTVNDTILAVANAKTKLVKIPV
jgi:hypothetical protein